MGLFTIFIFGGSSDQVFQVIQLIPDSCSVNQLPLDVKLDAINIKPTLILVIPEVGNAKGVQLLQELREKMPATAIIFIHENPSSAAVIEAFRLGVSDYLLFPLESARFLRAIEPYLQQGSFLAGMFSNWKSRLSRWLKKPTPPPPRGLLKSPLRFPPEGLPFAHPVLEKEPHELDVRLFGSLKIAFRGEQLPIFPGEKSNALLAFFLYHHQQPVHREILLTKFWEYTDPESARNSLNVATHNMRRHFRDHLGGVDLLQYANGTYRLNPALDVFTDTDQFLINWKKGRGAEQQTGLDQALPYYKMAAFYYQADFLDNIHYEEWCELERNQLREKYLLILDRLGTHFFHQEDFGMAVSIFQKMLLSDNCLEAIHRKVILCYYYLGQRDRAIHQYYKCAEALQKELDIHPSQATRELYATIKAEKKIPSLF